MNTDIETTENTVGRELRVLADMYEQAQRIRVETGERIRAIIQGRDETWAVKGEWADRDADAVLKSIAAGEIVGPVPILGRTYHRHALEEAETRSEMMRTLRRHPVWPWLERVKGIGPTLGCKLLARLDPVKAEYASSFWKYAGLATVPGEEYRCETCGLVRSWPVGYNVKGDHIALSDNPTAKKQCAGKLVKIRGPEHGVRTAERPVAGERSTYDRNMKKTGFLVGTAFLKAGDGAYERIYRERVEKLTVERPGWVKGRIHLSALRITEKLFLAHLWEVWRTALGLPVPSPYALQLLGHTGKIDPWSMVEEKKTHRKKVVA